MTVVNINQMEPHFSIVYIVQTFTSDIGYTMVHTIIVQKQITETTEEAGTVVERGKDGEGPHREKKLSGLLGAGNNIIKTDSKSDVLAYIIKNPRA